MHIAIPIWEDRVSPLFDAARRVVLVEIEESREVKRSEESIGASYPAGRVRRLVDLGVKILICGAISRRLDFMCASAGIQVIPWVTGSSESILQAFLAGKLPGPEYDMPGCCRGRGRAGRGAGRGEGRGEGRGRGREKNQNRESRGKEKL